MNPQHKKLMRWASVLERPDQKNRIVRLGSEAIWVFIGQVGVAVGVLMGVKILTHLLSPYEFGRVSIANTIVLLIGSNLFGPFGQGLMRFWSVPQYKEELTEYIALSGQYIKKLVLAMLLVAALSGLIVYATYKPDWTWIITLSLICGAFSGWAEVRLAVLMAARNQKNVALIKLLTAFAKPLFAACLILLIVHRADIAILGFFPVFALSAIYAERCFRKTSTHKLSSLVDEGGNRHDSDLNQSILSFSAPIFIWSFFAWAHQSCDKWALLFLFGADTVGAYAVISQFAIYPLLFGSALLSNFLIPIAYGRAGKLQSEASIISGKRVLTGMVLLYLAGAVVLVSVFYHFHRPLVLLISNEEYTRLSHFLPMLTCAWAFYYLGIVSSSFGYLVKKPKVYIAPILVSGSLTILATFVLGFHFGVQGVIWALCITGFLYASWCLVIAHRLMTVHRMA